MNKKLKKSKKKKRKFISPNYTLSAPHYDIYGAFQPWGYVNLYHHCEAEKMKRSYDWIQSAFEAEKAYSELKSKKIEENFPLIKTYIKEGILKVKIGEYDEEQVEEVPIISPMIEEGMLKVEFGDEHNKKVVYIDLKGYWSIVN